MRFVIEIGGETQPELIGSLDAARERLIEGACYLNICGTRDVRMRPADPESEAQFRHNYEAAHPKPTAPWTTAEGRS